MKINQIKPGKYVVAVSGGVDSVVLLDILSSMPEIDLVVAHFDHGIRDDSNLDYDFVEKLAEEMNLEFEGKTANLGKEASEDLARQKRYEFLYKVKEKHEARAIITAHHKDDVIETMVMNIMRGTGRKGLTSLRSRKDILRPLVEYTKEVLIKYAQENELSWREDPTNQDPKYTRNYLRNEVIPYLSKRNPSFKNNLFIIYKEVIELNDEIDLILNQILSEVYQPNMRGAVLDRESFLDLPSSIRIEGLQSILNSFSVHTRSHSKKLHLLDSFIQTATPKKVFQFSKNLHIVAENDTIHFNLNS